MASKRSSTDSKREEEQIEKAAKVDGAAAVSIPELFERVVAAKKALGQEVELAPPATQEEIAAKEASLGYPLNSQLKEVYKISNGGLLDWAKIETFESEHNDHRPLVNLYKALRMVAVDEYVHVSGSGLVFEWDSSFDGQCGNTIIADSVADLLTQWAERLEAEKTTGDAEKQPLSGWQNWRDRNKEEVDIDKSEAHKSFFSSFKRAYQRSFGSWPQYMS